MKLGTQIQFVDGRVATVVYNSLIGVGAKWGLYDPESLCRRDFQGTTGNTITESAPPGWAWEPDILLRAPWPGCTKYGWRAEQCIDMDYEILREGVDL